MEVSITTRMGRPLSATVYEKNWDKEKKTLGIVLIHAFPLNSEMYPMAEKIIDINFEDKWGSVNLVIPDLPGFGESATFAKAPENLEWYSNSINDLVNHLKLTDIVIGGCSMGGYIALNYIANYPTLGLILIDTRAEADSEEGKRGRLNIAKMIKTAMVTFPNTPTVGSLALRSKAIRDYFEGLAMKLVSKHYKHKVILQSIMDSQNPEAVRQALIAMSGRTDTSSVLKNYNGKVLVIVGKEDVLTPIEMSERLHTLANDSQFQIIEGSGHLVPLEKTDMFVQVLREWLKSQI